mmetsp:Transcript_16225/g.33545  ORF Transcript_16225/g.33545 Transcript_16225/m.33545 type:complete len:81 (+) Transcript_16225:514-756(+)
MPVVQSGLLAGGAQASLPEVWALHLQWLLPGGVPAADSRVGDLRAVQALQSLCPSSGACDRRISIEALCTGLFFDSGALQ